MLLCMQGRHELLEVMRDIDEPQAGTIMINRIRTSSRAALMLPVLPAIQLCSSLIMTAIQCQAIDGQGMCSGCWR